jgi:hypothetical protein
MSFKLVRCDNCGAKAHVAASQCPKCGFMLELRDSLGNAMPLERCRTCDTYHRRDRGPCRWCGDQTPAPMPVAPFVWSGAGALVVAGMLWGAWEIRGREPQSTKIEALAQEVVDSSTTPVSIVPAAEAMQVPATVPPRKEPAPVVTPAAPPEHAVQQLQVSQASMSSGSVRWVVATARTWANVRSAADRGSTVVGVITPETRVQLGETRAGWHRLRAGQIEGWVDHRLFAMESPGEAR